MPWLLTGAVVLRFRRLGMIYQNYWNLPIGLTIDGALALLWLLWLIRNPHSLQGRLLNLPVVAWVGRLSYSMYVWQTFFIHINNIDVFWPGRGGTTPFPATWLAFSESRRSRTTASNSRRCVCATGSSAG